MITQPTHTGLYYKLHGVRRPEAMKKTIIKRRKRVFLSNGSSNSIEQSSTVTTTIGSNSTPHTILPADESDVNPDVVGTREENVDLVDGSGTSSTEPQQSNAGNTTSPTYNSGNSPSPVDFTQSFRSQSPPTLAASSAAPTAPMTGSSAYRNPEDTTLAPLQLNQQHPNPPGLNQPSQRKRSISIASGEDNNGDGPVNSQRLNSISSILNPHSGSSNIDIPIEPSLLGLGPNATAGEEHRHIYLREKRLRLMREQERLSEEMEALDKEMETLMPLEGGGSSAIIQESGMMGLATTALTIER